MTLEKLAGKPKFAEVAERFLEFVDGAELVIHNAPFDVGLPRQRSCSGGRSARGSEPHAASARVAACSTRWRWRARCIPGQRNGLDALCKRYSIDNSHRELHGALLDARILADVYLAMTGGQSALALDDAVRAIGDRRRRRLPVAAGPPVPGALRVVEASAGGAGRPMRRCSKLISKASGGKALWQ